MRSEMRSENVRNTFIIFIYILQRQRTFPQWSERFRCFHGKAFHHLGPDSENLKVEIHDWLAQAMALNAIWTLVTLNGYRRSASNQLWFWCLVQRRFRMCCQTCLNCRDLQAYERKGEYTNATAEWLCSAQLSSAVLLEAQHLLFPSLLQIS